MSNVHQLPAARPFVLNREDGERIWFTNAAMTIKATAATTAGDLCLIETTAPIGHGPPLHVHHDEHEAFYVLEGELDSSAAASATAAARARSRSCRAGSRTPFASSATGRPAS